MARFGKMLHTDAPAPEGIAMANDLKDAEFASDFDTLTFGDAV